MKILHLIDSGGLYGAEKMLLALVQQQQHQGLSPMILSAGEPGIGEKPLEAEARRLRLPVMPWRMRPGFNLSGARKVLRWAQENGFELLHSHGYKFNVLMGIWPRSFRRLPLMATLHGYVKAPRYTKSWLYELLDRMILPRLHQIIVVSETMRTQIPQSLASSGKVSVIVNGLSTETVLEDSCRPVGEPLSSFFSKHRQIVLGVGRLSMEKGFDRLIQAFQSIKQSDPKVGLLIVGEGRQREVLEHLIHELELDDNVLLPGYVANVSALMAKASVLCLPSHTEGLPITLLEGMTVGVPVVVSSVGEMPSVLGHGQGGAVLEDLSEGSLAGALSEAMAGNPGVPESIAWARERVQSCYSDKAMAANYLQVYKKVLS
ncbi:glycosyltransferase [Marinobacter salinexigens]|uniref:Glycosyltransferase n=1 Tax=Marinobacter salinexigens TaxID=2919747 RepID=A0A5B0VL24_9GAMM|nr:glycosyltransferase [Marinobacter salinexigens]KAA1175043.1 glycosyltransferase [Marinobacter salinexigens]